ncbi:armadillo-type protein [Syncephalis fuscata]|nr:armadillo-type protein [Syncephalis fuscata]
MASHTATAQVLQALSALYGTSDSATKEQANRWLGEFQSTEAAWKTADGLLSDSAGNLEVRLFAAQTFRKKITYDLHQLDTAARLSLRDALLMQLAQYKTGPTVLITQICLALAALAMQLPEWTDVIPQMIKLYGSDAESASCLLEFITILPEEINGNHRIPITDDEFNERSRVLLSDSASEVFRLLVLYMQNSGTNVSMQTAWIRSGDIPIVELANSPLFNVSFDALQSPELFDMAVDVICEIIRETREVHEYMAVIEQIYTKLLSIRPMITAAADDEDQLRGLCRIFTEAGEAYVSLMVTHVEAFRGIIEGILACITANELDIVKMTFNFWYSLTQFLDTERHESVKPQFVEVFRSLVEIIIRHLHYPEDLSTWIAEERDDFRDFRHEMGDVLKDCCVILGITEALAIPCHRLEGLLATPTTPWQEIEAPLFSLRTMGSEVPTDEADMMPRIMSLLARLPEHPKIRYAAILVIARYTQWTSFHPEFIDYQMNLISRGFDNEEVSAASAMALKYLCKDASKLLVSYLTTLHPFYVNACKTLNRDDLLEITEALSHVISVVPTGEVLKTLQTFCLPVCQNLHEIASKGSQIPESERSKVAGTSPDVPHDQVHPCLPLVKDLMPVFDLLQTNLGSHLAVAEALCKCYTACVESYGLHFRPMLQQLMERLGATFAATDLSCYLWVARKCVRSLDGAADSAPMATAFVEALSSVMFAIVQKTAQVSEIPDVVEEYFDYYSSSTKTIQCAMACLGVNQPYPLISVLDFIREILASGLNVSNTAVYSTAECAIVVQVASEHGKTLTTLLVDSTFHNMPRDMVSDAAIILEIMAQLAPMEGAHWVAEEVGKVPENRLAPTKRDQFIKAYTGAIQNKEWRRLRRLINDLVAYYWRQNSRSSNGIQP